MSVTELEAGRASSNLDDAITRGSRWAEAACRALDVLLSTVMLVVLGPLFALIALAVRLDSPGPIIYRQRRFGRDLQPFTILKFRSMRAYTDHAQHRDYVVGLISGTGPEPADGSTMYKMTRDDRITRVGRFLRRSSLDELPQIWNVFRGEMSLVGPRPPLDYEIEHYPQHWFGRFQVPPGLTGLWQVSGRCELTHEEMIALDLEYARRRSLWLNIRILARTPSVIIRGRGAA